MVRRTSPCRYSRVPIPPTSRWSCRLSFEFAVKLKIAKALLRRLGLQKPHVCPGDCFANDLGVSGIILLALDVGPHLGRGHQAHLVPTPGARATNDAMRRKPRCRLGRVAASRRTQDVATLQLTADDHLPGSINAVHLKDRLGDVETDCRDRLHSWLLRIVGALTAPTSMALTCRWRSRPQHQLPTFLARGCPSG